MLTLGIPTLNRYDLLVKLIESAELGTLVPDKYLIVDNGGKFNETYTLDATMAFKVDVYNPGRNIGVAASWNYIINNTDNYRVISNDDLILDTTIIRNLVGSVTSGSLITGVSGLGPLNVFSIFCISDMCIKKIGYFDETISPNYAYFEDNDYSYRLQLAKIRMDRVHCTIAHEGSATIKAFNPKQEKEHHEKFKIARNNYIKKWGGMPHYETYETPFGASK